MKDVDILLPGTCEVDIYTQVDLNKPYPVFINPKHTWVKKKLKAKEPISMMWETGWGKTYYLPVHCTQCGEFQNKWCRYDVRMSVRYTGAIDRQGDYICTSKACSRIRDIVRQ